MPRRRRQLEPGLLHHVFTHAVDEQAAFRDDDDRQAFTARLTDVVTEQAWAVHTACLMGNHLHLVVDTPAGGLDVGMQRLLGGHATRFNHRHERRGHLFGGRYGSRVIDSEPYHAVVLRYVALNPVKDGFCRRPGDWRWSTHAALAGLEPAPEYLSFAGRDALFAGAADYVAWVEGGQRAHDLLDELLAIGGFEGVRAAVRAGYTQTAIAERLGTSQSSVSRALHGRGLTPSMQKRAG